MRLIGYNTAQTDPLIFKGHILSNISSNKPGAGIMKSNENDSVDQFKKPLPDESMAAEVYESADREEGHHTVSTGAYYGLEDYGHDGTQDWLEADVEMDGWLDTGSDF